MNSPRDYSNFLFQYKWKSIKPNRKHFWENPMTLKMILIANAHSLTPLLNIRTFGK